MFTFKSFALSAAAMLCALSPLDGSARVLRGSQAHLNQIGHGNSAAISQTGADNFAGIVQRGDNNTGAISQNGSRHYACLYQRGDGLDASIAQTGADQQVTIVQTEHWTRVGTDRVVIGRTGIYRCR